MNTKQGMWTVIFGQSGVTYNADSADVMAPDGETAIQKARKCIVTDGDDIIVIGLKLLAWESEPFTDEEPALEG